MKKRVYFQIEDEVDNGENELVGKDEPVERKEEQVEDSEDGAHRASGSQPRIPIRSEANGWNEYQDQGGKKKRNGKEMTSERA